jgi:hypothetical protein
MRAIWNCLPKWSFDDPLTAAKAEWRENFKVKLDSLCRAEMEGTITADEMRHHVYKVCELTTLLVYCASCMSIAINFDYNNYLL